MTLPTHVNPTQDAAKAPYNFVPLPDRVVTVNPADLPDQDRYVAGTYTGYIECDLTTEAPTYVRAPLTPEEFERQEKSLDEKAPWREQVRNKPDFFHTDPSKTPRIPGSSLRGMLRQLVEIVGFGKMEVVSIHHLVYRAVGDTTSHGNEYRKRIMREDGQGQTGQGKRFRQYTPLVEAGYMEQDPHGDWVIRPAQKIGGVSFARIRIDDIPPELDRLPGCKNASRIHVQAGAYDYQEVKGGFLRIKYAKVVRAAKGEAPGLVPASLARSGPMESKRSEAVVFAPDQAAPVIPVSDVLVRTYREQISQEQADLLGSNGVLTAGQPVFFLRENRQLVFFGHTMMMRLPYHKSPQDFIPAELRREADVDLAEAIFGYTKKAGEGKARSYASRISVGDAVLAPNQAGIWLKPRDVIIPKILGSPKPTTFQHYLTQQAPDAQEEGRRRDGSPIYVKRLTDYAASTPSQTVLRGHKLYWHKGVVTADDLEEALEKLRDERGREKEHDTQHTQVRPVAAGVRFRFRITFENLADVELGALLWALTLPGQPGKQYRHSIGMGKPYGMGAIKLEPALFISDRAKRYGALFARDTWEEGTEESSSEIPGLVGKFDAFMRQQIKQGNRQSLADVERIQMLLKMLEWPGPDKSVTRYLEIEHRDPAVKRGKINEYKNRPVLPDPLRVEPGRTRPPTSAGTVPGRSSQIPPSAPPSTTQAPRPASAPSGSRPPAPPPAQPTPPAPPKREAELSHPASSQEITEGMYLEGKVLRVESGRVVVDILGEEATLVFENISPLGRDQEDIEERFAKGKTIRVRVRGRNQRGRLQLTMRRP